MSESDAKSNPLLVAMMQLVLSQCGMALLVPLDDLIALMNQIEHEEALGPILDPTQSRNVMHKLTDVRAAVHAFADFRAAIVKIQKGS